jgi:hypothetical protein
MRLGTPTFAGTKLRRDRALTEPSHLDDEFSANRGYRDRLSKYFKTIRMLDLRRRQRLGHEVNGRDWALPEHSSTPKGLQR